MPLLCNACNSPIAPDDINVQADTALCRACGGSFPYSSLVHAPTSSMYTAPPPGCHVELVGDRWRAVASLRSWRSLHLVLFAFLSLLVMSMMSLSMLRSPSFPWPMFGLAFVYSFFGIGMFWNALCALMGTVEVVIEPSLNPSASALASTPLPTDLIRVATGIGPLRYWRWRELGWIHTVRQGPRTSNSFSWSNYRNPRAAEIILSGPKPLGFGIELTDERKQFLHAVVATEIKRRRSSSPT